MAEASKKKSDWVASMAESCFGFNLFSGQQQTKYADKNCVNSLQSSTFENSKSAFPVSDSLMGKPVW